MDATPERMRLDELARHAGVASTTIRLYQNKGLLPGPELVGRTGWYGPHHLTRLALIGRLQDEGFSLAGIGRLLATWEEGRDLTALVGDPPAPTALVLNAAELAERLPADRITPADLQRAVALGLIEPTADGRFRIPDARFLETGAALVGLGVPVAAVLDEWAHLRGVTDRVAQRFIAVFEEHLWSEAGTTGGADVEALASTLAELRRAAGQVVAAALDASITAEATKRIEALAATPAPARSSPSPRRRRASGGPGSGR